MSSQPEQAQLGSMNVWKTNPPELTGRVVRRRARLGVLASRSSPTFMFGSLLNGAGGALMASEV